MLRPQAVQLVRIDDPQRRMAAWEKEQHMGIGSGIVLFVLGAILAFALNVEVDWINLDLVGYLLMGAGFIIFLISLVLYSRRRTTNTPPDIIE